MLAKAHRCVHIDIVLGVSVSVHVIMYVCVCAPIAVHSPLHLAMVLGRAV